MAMEVLNPFEEFHDLSGNPLDNGYIYIGTEGQNPETNPIAIYWDNTLTTPAANPVRTISGYPSRNGSPARIYAISTFSITVKDSQSKLVHSSLIGNKTSYSTTIGTIAALRLTPYAGQQIVSVAGYYTAADNIGVREYFWDAISVEADNGGTIIQVTGVVTGRWKMKYSGAVNVKWFGAKGDSTVPYTFGDIPVGTDDTLAFKACFEGGFSNVHTPDGAYLITDTITPTPMNITSDNATIVFETLDKTKPAFIASNQARKTWSNFTIVGTAYLPLAGIQFKVPDNQAMVLDNVRVELCRHGVYGEVGENINRMIFRNCNFSSNMIAGFWMKSYDTVYAHSAPVFFENTIINANGIPTFLTTQTYKGVLVKETTLKWGVQFYYKGVSTLVWTGGQISDHSANQCLAHVLIQQANGVTFSNFDFEDMQNPVRLDGTSIATPSTNTTVYSSLEGGAITISGVSDVNISINHTFGISQQSFIKLEYTCNNVVLALPNDNKMTGCRYSVNTFGQGSNNTTIKVLTPTTKISNATFVNISNASLINILNSGNKLGTYYAPVGGVGIHFDTSTIDAGTKYVAPYSATNDLKGASACSLRMAVYGMNALGVKLYANNIGYDSDMRLIISYYDSSDTFISSSTPITVRPIDNPVSGHGVRGMVSDIPSTAKFARIGFLNSANYNALIPDHGSPISFSVFALGNTEFSTNPVSRNIVV
jgi:hypothetical protein